MAKAPGAKSGQTMKDYEGSSFIAKGHESMMSTSSARRMKSGGVAECFLNHNYFPGDPEFTKIIKQVEDAIEAGIYPQIISQGSSGSYFARNIKREAVGVYKPKNEEPYGPRNPKWTKWFQKVLCPCCFGRGCLLMNQGYLSEAGASLINDKLNLNIVPKTKVVWLSAPTFNYSRFQRRKADSRVKKAAACPKIGRRFHKIGLPPKVGSMQLFVRGYKDATTFLAGYNIDNAPDNENVKKEFTAQFERLVVLDYIIRNTDRGSDNWLIKKEPEPKSPAEMEAKEPRSGTPSLLSAKSAQSLQSARPRGPSQRSTGTASTEPLKIAAIDNGLAFPFKHPDEWRAYPFGWASLKQAREPFSDEICELVLHNLENINFVEEMCDDLKHLFKLDKEFKETTFEKQMAVMRGQILNLTKALKEKMTPYDLVQMTPMTVIHQSGKTPGRKQRSRWSMYNKSDAKIKPWFRGF